MRNPGRKTGQRKSSQRPRQGSEGTRSSEVRGLPQRSQAAEHAVNTWYAAHIVMYVTFKDASQDHYPVWENIVLIEAPTEDEAFSKAEVIGRGGEGDSDGTFRWNDRPARWNFGGVRKPALCQNADEKPGDGTEVTYLQFKVRSKKDLDRLLNSDEVTVTFDEEFNRNGHAESKPEPAHPEGHRLLAKSPHPRIIRRNGKRVRKKRGQDL